MTVQTALAEVSALSHWDSHRPPSGVCSRAFYSVSALSVCPYAAISPPQLPQWIKWDLSEQSSPLYYWKHLGFCWPFDLPSKFKNWLPRFHKNPFGIFTGIAFNLQINLRRWTSLRYWVLSTNTVVVDWTVSSQNSYVETLPPVWLYLETGPLRRWLRSKEVIRAGP